MMDQVKELYIQSQFYKEWGVNSSMYTWFDIQIKSGNPFIRLQLYVDGVEYRTVRVYFYG